MTDKSPVPCGDGVFKDVRITKLVKGLNAADYEFECTTLDGRKKTIVAKGAPTHEDEARRFRCAGHYGS